MSSLIRARYATADTGGGFPDIRSLSDSSLRPHAQEVEALAPMVSPSDARIAALTEEVAELKEALRLSREEAEEESAAALAEGRKLAEEEFRRDEKAVLDLLDRHLADAAERLEAAFVRSERAGLALARAALERVLGPGAASAGMCEAIIRHQMQMLRSEHVLAIRISEEVFCDGTGADEIHDFLSSGQVELIVDPVLPAGDCRIVLRLGELEVGPETQWRALAALFAELAGE